MNSRGTALSFSKSGIAAQPQISLRSRVWLVPKAVLMAILCGSYKTEFAALSKLNLVRKILAHVRQAISQDTPSADLQTGKSTARKPCRFANDRFPQGSGPRPTGENERKQVMLCLPLRLPLATELLIR